MAINGVYARGWGIENSGTTACSKFHASGMMNAVVEKQEH